MSDDAAYLKYVKQLVASKGAAVRTSHRLFHNSARSRREIIAIVKKCETLHYGQQDDYLKSVDVGRSTLHNWRKKVARWAKE